MFSTIKSPQHLIQNLIVGTIVLLSFYFFHSPFILAVQILGTGMDTQDTSPSILLFFDKQRFIFNAGEV